MYGNSTQSYQDFFTLCMSLTAVIFCQQDSSSLALENWRNKQTVWTSQTSIILIEVEHDTICDADQVSEISLKRIFVELTTSEYHNQMNLIFNLIALIQINQPNELLRSKAYLFSA